MKQALVRAALFSLAVIISAAPAAAETKLRIATEGTYPPWNYRDESGKLVGWDIDIANALCERMKASCEIIAQDWDGIIPSLLVHKYDMIVASMGITAKRQQQVAFTHKYKDTVSQFVAKKGAFSDFSLGGLAGKRIGVQRGSIQHDFLMKTYPKSDIIVFDKTTDVELALLADRIDLLFANKVTSFMGLLKRPEAAGYELMGPEFKGGILVHRF
jgi:polar amino acid transport system substrate-binding protein/arginine/ornithine transport system substrate-binding protein